jgi:hypothetical protein
MFAGLWYPIAIALMSVVIGGLAIRETKDVRIWDEVGGRDARPEPGRTTRALTPDRRRSLAR